MSHNRKAFAVFGSRLLIGIWLIFSGYTAVAQRKDCVANFLSGRMPHQQAERMYTTNGFYLTGKDTLSFDSTAEILVNNNKLRFVVTDTNHRAWYRVVDHTEIKVYSLKEKGRSYVLVSSYIYGVSGWATELAQWLLVDLNADKYYIFESLTRDPSYFFIRNGSLYFYTLTYQGGEIDWDNLYVDVNEYRQSSSGDLLRLGSWSKRFECR